MGIHSGTDSLYPWTRSTRIIPLELNGRSFKASHLTSGQAMIIAGIDTKNVAPSDLADIIDILHACVGDDEWHQIKRGLISGKISSHDVLDIFGQITNAPKPEKITLNVDTAQVASEDPEIVAAEAHLRKLMDKRGQLTMADRSPFSQDHIVVSLAGELVIRAAPQRGRMGERRARASRSGWRAARAGAREHA